MSPLVLPHTRSLLDTQPSQSPAFMSTTAGRVVFILCIVFGSLLLCMLIAALVYFVRRHKRKKRDTLTLNLHREASFIAGAPSVIDIIPPQPARRPSTRNANAAQSPRIVIPSPELGSVFRLDALPNMPRRGSSAVTRSRSGSGSPTPKAPTPPYESLFSGTSTVITCSGMDKYDVPLRVMNHSSLASSIEPQLQKPTPAYRTGRNSSQEHLVSSKASADSLFSGSTSTPPLSPAIWSHSGTIHSPTDVSLATAATVHKSPSEQSFSTVASSPPRVALRCIELPPELGDAEQTPRAYGPLSRPPPVDQHEQPAGMTGTPVTLSHFPFRFSCDAPSSPGLSAVHGSPVPSSSLGALSPHRSYAHLSIRASPAHALGLHAALADSQQSLPSHSTPALKLKVKHRASDEIIAIVFAPQSINFAAVSDAVRGRLGFEPRRVWSDEGTEVTNDASLWSWLEEQYTQGHTRLMLHVE